MPGEYHCLRCDLLWDGAHEKLLGLHLAILAICRWQGRRNICANSCYLSSGLLQTSCLNIPNKAPLVPFLRRMRHGELVCLRLLWKSVRDLTRLSSKPQRSAELTQWFFLQTWKLMKFIPSYCKYIWHCAFKKKIVLIPYGFAVKHL